MRVVKGDSTSSDYRPCAHRSGFMDFDNYKSSGLVSNASIVAQL